jgi:hypothetical protein
VTGFGPTGSPAPTIAALIDAIGELETAVIALQG